MRFCNVPPILTVDERFVLFTRQIRRKKNVKKGIQFCLMVCGASGTGISRISRYNRSVLPAIGS
jgi:hypothetical protein